MALGQHRTVLQIVGYQNSGKTTLAEKLISYACNKGLRVGSIKHHGHGGAPASNLTKDSTRHAQAGAVVSAVEGDGVVQLQLAKNTYWPTFPQALCEKIPHFALQDEAAYLSFLVTKEGC